MAISSQKDVQILWNGDKLFKQVLQGVGLGLKAGAIFFSGRVQEILSVPAPRVAGVRPYRAATAATPGAPPRKLSGSFRRTITWQINSSNTEAKIGTNDKRAKGFELGINRQKFPMTPKQRRYFWWAVHEGIILLSGQKSARNAHPFLMPTLNRWKGELARIIGTNATGNISPTSGMSVNTGG